MYAIDGRRDLTETTRDDLSGYAGARPVRIGNGAFDQRQNDVYGAALDSILLHTRRSRRLVIGEIQRSRDLIERLLRAASPLGLYAEEFDVDTSRHLGNFPQAFSHLALIEAAARIIIAEAMDRVAG